MTLQPSRSLSHEALLADLWRWPCNELRPEVPYSKLRGGTSGIDHFVTGIIGGDTRYHVIKTLEAT